MTDPADTTSWEHVFVRHTVDSRRDDVGRLFHLLQDPFAPDSHQTHDKRFHENLTKIPNKNRTWMIAAELPKWSWVPLYSTSAGKKLYEANAASRRLDVVWIGCDPKGSGWFFRLCRAAKTTVDFTQGVEKGAKRTFQSSDLTAGFLARCSSAEKAFQRLCQKFDITLPIPRVQATDEAFEVRDHQGRRARNAIRDVHIVYGPQIRSKKGDAYKRLVRAIQTCNAKGIRRAVDDGASLTTLPDSSITPLEFALENCQEPGWKDCVATLVELGCEVKGDVTPIITVACTLHNDESIMEGIDFLLSLGADIDEKDRSGWTLLAGAVYNRRINLVRSLIERGANPKARMSGGSIIAWTRKKLEKTKPVEERRDLAEILSILTGEEVEVPQLPVLPADLQAENDRFRLCHEVRGLVGSLPKKLKIGKRRSWPFFNDKTVDSEPYDQWAEQLVAKGFEFAGFYEPDWTTIYVVAGFTHAKLRLDATLYMQYGLDANCCCEITAYHAGEAVTIAASHRGVASDELLPIWMVREQQQGASPDDLIKLVTRLVSKRKKRKLAIDAATFRERYAQSLERLLDGIRRQSEQVLATPNILIGGKPARFERRRHYLDLSDFEDLAASSKSLADFWKEELKQGVGRKGRGSQNDRLRDGMRGAAELAAMRHFQYAGAPESLDHLDQGVECVARYQKALGKRGLLGSGDLALGMLLTALAGRWDVFDDLCSCAKARTADVMFVGKNIGYEHVLLAVASEYSPRAIPNVATRLTEVRRKRHLGPKFSLQMWEAILAESQKDFSTTLRQSLDHLKDHPWSDDRPNQLIPQLAVAESILYMVGLRRGMQPVRLTDDLGDLLIRPETIGADR